MPNTPPPIHNEEQSGLQKFVLIMGGIYLALRFFGGNLHWEAFYISAAVIYALWWVAGYVSFVAINLPRWIGLGAYRVVSTVFGYMQFFHARRYKKARDKSLPRFWRFLLKTHIAWLIFLVPTAVKLLNTGVAKLYGVVIWKCIIMDNGCLSLDGKTTDFMFFGTRSAHVLATWGLPIVIFGLWLLAGYKNGLSGSFKDFGNQSEYGFRRERFHEKEQNRGNGSTGQASNDRAETPYGFDKRHPDDAKLWAFVDDPNASDQERKTALEKILKKRKP